MTPVRREDAVSVSGTGDPRIAHNIVALVSLLPLLESHLDLHGRIVSRAQWESAYDPPPKGYVPPDPEPDCEGRCSLCLDFTTPRCTLRQEYWAVEWERLRKAYPELLTLEKLCRRLMVEHPQYASALYWTLMQPWDRWNPSKRETWFNQGIEWLAREFKDWLPTYTPKGMPAPDPPGERKRAIVALRTDGLSFAKIADRVGCSKTYVGQVLRAMKVR